uniref:Disease resistance protein At4g27190-like leucine-rich repeats domain-containing protein n=1 Tax=Ananas comosus var. bracteatus TaxID=296719 RepID=A0A6V7PPS7_ANACO|nr:unnamed protein product [Ananas comosus var. bracteatus]
MNIEGLDYKDAKSVVLGTLLRGSFQKMYVEAWKGVGATALLREVAEAVEKSEKREFETVIKVVRPAPFRNPREMQRAVAEQLNHLLLPTISSLGDGCCVRRGGRRRRLLAVDGIQLKRPASAGRSRGIAVLWTSGMNISGEAASVTANWIVRIQPSHRTTQLELVYKEAVEIARYIHESSGGSLRTTPQVVLRCFWYYLLLLRRAAFNRSALLPDDGRPLEAAVKYFVCDGILQGDDAAAWEIGRALAPVIGPMTLLVDSTITQGDWVKLSLPSTSSEEEEEEESYRWISVRSPQTNIPEPWDFFFFKAYGSSVLSDVSSFFGHFEKAPKLALPDGFFDHFSNIRVLDLLDCIVSPIGYSSFLRLRNLRMLMLEQCQVTSLDPNSHSSAREGRREPILLDNLWVLNLYNSDADGFLLGGKAFELMPNLLELGLTDCEAAPLPNLKTFRLSGSKLIAKLSLQGCRKLENVDLQKLTGLEVLDLSCTAIKLVDISKFLQLKQLFLLGCEQLRRVVCCEDIRHPKGPRLDVLYLDNYNGGGACNVDQCLDSFRNQKPSELTKGTNDADQRLFHAHVVVKDVRLFRSLRDAFPDRLSRAKSCFHIHVKGSSTAKRGTNIGTTTRSALCYADVLNTMTDRHRRHHPSPPAMPLNNHIEVDGGHDSRIVVEIGFNYIMRFANSLFIHDNTSKFTMGIQFRHLKCFRIERCPKMAFIFSYWDAADSLESIWLSQLPRLKALLYGRIRSGQLKHIYLEFCARLEYVLPSLSELHDLETINIRYCGNLTAIFKSDDDDNKDKRRTAPKLLPKLRSIHLQELPKLQNIYKLNICAPSLEEIKIMGCLNLRKLPLFGRSDARSMRAVKISCEKDWWDKLQWDGLKSNHHFSLFNPKHCSYYKKRMKATYL